MRIKKNSFSKIVITFAISPGFSGILLLTTTVLLDFFKKIDTPFSAVKAITDTVLLGFFGGLIFYFVPAFILGLIYANLELKRSWKSYLLVATFSPTFILIQEFIFEYILPKNTIIPGTTRIDMYEFIIIIGPLSSISSIIAAWISFPKEISK